MATAQKQKNGGNGAKKNGANKKTGVVILAAAGAATAAAAAYFFLSPKSKEARTAMKSWMVKAKGEVLEQIEKVKKIDPDTYFGIVDTVVARYQKLRQVNARELAAFGKELKGQWNEIAKGASATSGSKAKAGKGRK